MQDLPVRSFREYFAHLIYCIFSFLASKLLLFPAQILLHFKLFHFFIQLIVCFLQFCMPVFMHFSQYVNHPPHQGLSQNVQNLQVFLVILLFQRLPWTDQAKFLTTRCLSETAKEKNSGHAAFPFSQMPAFSHLLSRTRPFGAQTRFRRCWQCARKPGILAMSEFFVSSAAIYTSC